MPSPPTTPAAFRAWLRRAAPGDRLEYHRGLLTRDRAPRRAAPVPFEPHRRRLDALAAAALAAAEAGRVHLVQRRHGPVDFAYLAVKADPGPGAAAPAVRPRVPPYAARPPRAAPPAVPAAA